jgi:hypothetical protein
MNLMGFRPYPFQAMKFLVKNAVVLENMHTLSISLISHPYFVVILLSPLFVLTIWRSLSKIQTSITFNQTLTFFDFTELVPYIGFEG